MYKKGFVSFAENQQEGTAQRFLPATDHGVPDSLPAVTVDIYEKNDSKYFVLQTTSLQEYLDGLDALRNSGYIYDDKKDNHTAKSLLFQKANITVQALMCRKDTAMQYTFSLQQRNVPDSIQYAEDLLRFDSHEFLRSYFGKNNVREDLYYLSEKEVKRCSVLFGGTHYQAVFVWGDQENLDSLEYVLVSNVLPTKGAERNGVPDGDNQWKFRSGIHWGMPLRDMLRLNEMDFYIFGNKSEFALAVKPENTGKIDFKKTAIMFSCDNCSENEIWEQPVVSALEAAKANLPMKVFDIIIYR